jgi:hypothetical protein
MNLDDELKRLGLLGDAERAFSAKLDEIENYRTPQFVRKVSHEPKDGYNWNEYFEHYEEGDDLFRARINAAIPKREQ